MEENENKHREIDALLGNILKEPSLRDLFDKRVYELGLSERDVRRMLKLEYRTINGIIDGTQRRGDILSFKKLATFLNIPLDDFLEMHSSLAEANNADKNTVTQKKKFLKDNFDLAVLRKAGFINSLDNFDEIENKITLYFGLSSIFEYKKRAFNTAYWTGIVSQKSISKTSIVRDFWLTSAKILATKIDNPYIYIRQNLVAFFPQIRWFSTNEEFGLINVIKHLFSIGITVIYQPKLSSLKLRGATFSVNNKPCIVITDYMGFYPTLWHCLIHELYHVLFDWDIINKDSNSYHISDDSEELFTIDEREIEADNFARRYLFSIEKMEEVKPHIYDYRYINEVARDNNVHPAIIHSYYAYDNGKKDRMAWIRAKRYMPDVKIAVHRLENNWDEVNSIEEVAKKLKMQIYN